MSLTHSGINFTMATLWTVLFCCWFSAHAFAGNTRRDFADSIHANIDFIYHDSQDLLLTSTDDHCYFTTVNHFIEHHLQTDRQFQAVLEKEILIAILSNTGLRETTLSTVRNAFGDLLADYHCLNKTIYLLHVPAHSTTATATTSAPTTTPPVQVCPIQHGRYFLEADLTFLIDASHSVDHHEFELAKDFMVALADQFLVAPHALRVAVVVYDRSVRHVLYFDHQRHLDQVKDAIHGLTYPDNPAEPTASGAALLFAREVVFDHTLGDRPDVPNALVVVTDGPSQTPDHTQVVVQSALLHQEHVQVVVLGVTTHDRHQQDELAAMASSQWSNLHVAQYNQLHTAVDSVRALLCANRVA